MATTEDKIEICPDNHQCEHGSICVENPNAEGKFFCDCDESALNGATVYSGLYCQHEATVFCTLKGTFSRTSFCTNRGVCRGRVEETSEHLGCECPSGYTGKHCQYVEGSEPEDYPYDDSVNAPALTTGDDANMMVYRGGDGTGIGTPGLVVIILLVAAVLGISLSWIIRRRRQYLTAHTIETTKSSDGHLYDADGENLEVPTTQTFETEEENDDMQIKAVDSGHLA